MKIHSATLRLLHTARHTGREKDMAELIVYIYNFQLETHVKTEVEIKVMLPKHQL
jgi:hypothetical protein